MNRLGSLLGCALLLSFQWPAPPRRLLVNFLQTGNAGISRGIVFQTHSPEAAALQQGEILFLAQGHADFRRNYPYPGGQFLVCEHPEGLRSVLSGVRLQESIKFKQRLQAGERVGELVDVQKGMQLLMIRENRYFINPLDLLPTLNLETNPRLVSVVLLDSSGKEFTLFSQNLLPVGFYKARMVTADQEQTEVGTLIRRPLRSWSLTIDAVETREWKLHQAEWTHLGPRLQDGQELDSWVKNNQEYDLGTVFIKVGLNTLEVAAVAFNNRRISQLYRIVGRRP